MAAWSEGKGALRPPTVRVSELVSPREILFAEAGQEKAALLDALIARVADRHGLSDKTTLASKVREREQGISTTLDTGVSLPHARLDQIDSVVAALGVARVPLTDPSHPEIPIRAMFLFFSPNKQQFFGMHLQILRSVSALFTPALLERLAAAKSADEAYALLRLAETSR